MHNLWLYLSSSSSNSKYNSKHWKKLKLKTVKFYLKQQLRLKMSAFHKLFLFFFFFRKIFKLCFLFSKEAYIIIIKEKMKNVIRPAKFEEFQLLFNIWLCLLYNYKVLICSKRMKIKNCTKWKLWLIKCLNSWTLILKLFTFI